jgi:transcriptional regulator with XRE-family HTH domain
MSSENTQKKPGEALGKIVRNARKSKSLTQADCASLCGLGRRHFQKIEAGEVNPPLAFFSKLSGVLDTRACYFLNNESLDSPLSDYGVACESEILDLLPTPVFIATLKGDLIYRNSSFIKRFGSRFSHIDEIFCDEADRKTIRDQILTSASTELPQIARPFRLVSPHQTHLIAQISWSSIAPTPSRTRSAVLGVATLLPSQLPNGTY